MLAIEFESAALGVDTADYLTPEVATLVLLAYGAIFSLIALVTSMRRDID
jgi:hypothetical protein